MMWSARTAISLFCLLAAVPAQAHIVTSPDHGAAGAWFRSALMVTHGCDGAATTSVTVQIPKDILIIRPQMKAGWTISIEKETLDKPVPGPHGSTLTETTKSITWTGNLPDAYFDEFGLTMKLPEHAGTLYLPTLQTCGKVKRDWKDIPVKGQNPHALENPAPSLRIEPGSPKIHQH